MQFFLKCKAFQYCTKQFVDMVQKEIFAWENKSIPFYKANQYLDIINIMNVYDNQYTITIPLNITQDNLHVTLKIYFIEEKNVLQFQMELSEQWEIPNKLTFQSHTLTLCKPITSPTLLRKLKHYKGRKQVEFLPITSLFLTIPDYRHMYPTHKIIYNDRAVAFVDIATEKSIHVPTNMVNKSTNQHCCLGGK